MNLFEGYRITSPYGQRRDPINGSKSFHTGVDMVLHHRAPIRAFMPGKVNHARLGRPGTGYGGFGNVVAIEDEYGATQMYAHLDSIAAKVGDVVKAGDVIGYQGSTGRSTGSHLHFEVRLNGYGTHTDPGEYLKKYMKEDEQMLNPEDAEKIIKFLSAGWFASSGNKSAQEEFHRLAEEVRRVTKKE